MESARLATAFVVRGSILAARLPDLSIKTTKAPVFQGWETQQFPKLAVKPAVKPAVNKGVIDFAPGTTVKVAPPKKRAARKVAKK